MKLKRLYLQGFRNYPQKLLDFDAKVMVLVGGNGLGKTNILEAVYLLATGNSFRAETIEEMISFEEEIAHVGGVVELDTKNEEVQLKMVLTRGLLQGKKVTKRRYLVNDVPKRKMDFVGNIKVVAFLPEDMQMIGGSPSLRRTYLNETLAQVSVNYWRSLTNYEKGLVRRNKILDLIMEGKTNRSALFFWDELLIKHGNEITDARRDFVTYINNHKVGKGFEGLRIEYDPSIISKERLEQYARQEVAAGHTLVGPHRDDFKVSMNNGNGKMVDLGAYGSRGQQRMGVLWLKLVELAFMKDTLHESPLLLLDDVFSELDGEHEKMVVDLMQEQQTLVTTTEMDGRFEGVGEIQVEKVED